MKKQMEMMSLYKESGASPLSGCLPMLIQMPILLAVFRFFPSSFELRQQSFLWADDLSSFDSIWDFGFYIPIYGDHMSLIYAPHGCYNARLYFYEQRKHAATITARHAKYEGLNVHLPDHDDFLL